MSAPTAGTTRFDKKQTMVNSPEYRRLLALEIKAWGVANPQNNGGWAQMQKTIAYRTYRRGTIEKQLDLIRQQGENLDLLELGSADGWFSNEILALSNVRSMTSIDVALTQNTSTTYNSKVKLVKGDLNLMEEIQGLKGQKFDCILTRGTLHHLVDPHATVDYAINQLLKKDGILVIEDSWVRQSLQFKTNAFLYLALYVLPHSIFDFLRGIITKRGHESLSDTRRHIRDLILVLFSSGHAEAITHNHSFSPFESISSADDYKQIYEGQNIAVRYFRNFAALPAWHHTYFGRIKFLGEYVIQPIDDLLIRSRLFVGDLHMCILQKK